MTNFNGFGLVRPFQRDLRNDFAAAGDAQLVRSAVGQILATVGSSGFTQGEVPWRTEFGSLLHLLRHQRNDHVLQELARVYVVEALSRWEPRVVVTSVRVTRSSRGEECQLLIHLSYDVVPTQSGAIVARLEQTVLV
jgi:phage baseplate assembly protein W